MAAAESASASLGPRYAPDDPTLAKPWKGLIDGSTGVLYYWNPETNVTQYERPASAPPPLPPGPPPTATSVPKLAPIPVARTLQPNGTMPQTGQQMIQQSSQQVPPHQQQQQTQQMPLHQASQQLQYQQPGQQMAQQPSQQQLHQQPGQQMPHQQLQQYPYMQAQLQQMSHQQFQYAQAQQMPRQQGQQPVGQQMGHQQGQQAGFSRVEETGPQQSRQIGFSSVQVEPTGGVYSNHNQSAGSPQVQNPQMGVHPLHLQQHMAGASPAMARQNNPSLAQLQHGSGSNHVQQHMGVGPTTPNLMGPGMVRTSMPAGPPIGSKTSYEEDQHGKMGNEFYPDGSKEMSTMAPQQPKLAAIPLARDHQEMRMGSIPPQFVGPGVVGGSNMAPGRTMPNMFGHGFSGQPLPSAIPMRPPLGMLGPSDFTDLSAADMYCKQHEVSATGDNVPAPFMTFETTGFPSEILREMQLAGFLSPTPIQAQTWPVALQGRDIVAIAKTGSGKTLGYLVPAFLHLRRCRNNPQIGPTVLVLAPTRELATQIQDEALKFGGSSRISCTCLYGGAPKGPQLREVERGADIIVATPGRLNDILEMGKINFHQVSYVVLDEADRMLDMGFEPQIRKIVNEIPPRRQTLMYTATWPKEVRKIAGDLLVNPVQVNIGSVDELAANKAITQYVEVVPPMEKQRRLEQILRSQERGSKIIIFCSTKRLCDQLARSIGRSFGAAAIHGDKSQGERDWVLNQFRSGKAPILVATDVAARGLDIKDIRVVINYDFPTGIEDYVHRIGRTGRAGATGISYTFFSDQDWKYAADLVKVLEGANQQVPPQVREMAVRGGPVVSKGRGGISRWESPGGRWDSGGGRGMMREGGGGRWDSGGGRGMRDGGGRFGGRGGRDDFFGGRGMRGRGPGGLGGRGRGDRGPYGRYNMDGRGRYDNRRGERSRDRSYSRSPDRVRTWSYDRSRSQSRSRSRSRSWTRSRSYSRSPSRSRSRSRDRVDRPRPRSGFDVRPPSGFDVPPPSGLDVLPRSGFDVPPPSGSDAPEVSGSDGPPGFRAGSGVETPAGPEIEGPLVPGFTSSLAREMSPMSPGPNTGSIPNIPAPDGSVARPGFPEPLGDV